MIMMKFFQKVSHLQGFLKIVVLDQHNKIIRNIQKNANKKLKIPAHKDHISSQ